MKTKILDFDYNCYLLNNFKFTFRNVWNFYRFILVQLI